MRRVVLLCRASVLRVPDLTKPRFRPGPRLPRTRYSDSARVAPRREPPSSSYCVSIRSALWASSMM